MYTLAHLSDIHLSPLPRVRISDLFSKRITGYLNYRKNRAHTLTDGTLELLIDDIKFRNPDHIALTGDLVNIALDEEFENTASWLKALGSPERVSLVGGNHDAYVHGAFQKAMRAWSPYMTGDNSKKPAFPYLKRRGALAIIGLSSAVPKPPFFATGTLGNRQLVALEALLNKLEDEDSIRIILIHHPPHPDATKAYKRLTDGGALIRILEKCGAELVLHGHTHKRSTRYIRTENGKSIPIIGVPSASSSFGGHGEPAGYNLFEFKGVRTNCEIIHIKRDFIAPETIAETSNHQLTSPGQS